jgi:hypothetical protein
MVAMDFISATRAAGWTWSPCFSFRMRSSVSRVTRYPAKDNKGQKTEPGQCILGPNFSGSLTSLAELLHESKACLRLPVSIHSGSVTGDVAIDAFMGKKQGLGAYFVPSRNPTM